MENKINERLNNILKQDILSREDLIYLYSNVYTSKEALNFIKKRNINKDYEYMKSFKEKYTFVSRILQLIHLEELPPYSLTINDIHILKECMICFDSYILLISDKVVLDNEEFIRYVALNSKNSITLIECLPEKYFSNIRVMSNAMYNNLNFLLYINYFNYGDATSIRKYTRFLRLLNDKNNQKVLLNTFWLSYIKDNNIEELNEQHIRALKFYFSNDILSNQENFIFYGPQEKKVLESPSYKLIKKYIKNKDIH